MPTYYDSKNQAHVLTGEIGRGGEGAVYALEDLTLVAKIYHEPVNAEKTKKLYWMAANKNDQLLRVAAWVVDVLYDRPDGYIAGFLMPNVRAKEIHELYSLKSRRVHFPEATWPYLIHTAANLARAFYNMHNSGHVVGDVNHGNCVVLANGTVKLIDCDSYSIQTSEGQYPCEVGVLTHLAPELHGRNLSEVKREPVQDNFGLAVIIFQLLFLGRHPFSGNYLGAKDKTLEDCIREYRFAYGAGAKLKRVQQPPGTLSLAEVSPRVAKLFERAFAEGEKRPEAREWIEALEDLGRTLEQCSLHPGHHYFQELVECPWCRIEAETGLLLFPFVTQTNALDGEESFNVFTIENLLENLGIERNLPTRPPVSDVLPPPSPGIVEGKKDSQKRQIGIVVAHFVLISLLMIFFGIAIGVFFGLILMLSFIIYLNNTERTFRDTVNQAFYKTRQEWTLIEKDWNKAVVPPAIEDDLVRIRKKIGEYQKIQQVNLNQLKQLQDDAAKRKVGISSEEKERFLLESSGKRRLIEREIEGIFASLRSASLTLRRNQKQIVKKAEEVGRELVQAESNMEALGTNSAAILALLLITFLTPFLGGIISELSSGPAVSNRLESSTSTISYSDGGTLNKAPLADISTKPDLPAAGMTDKEIGNLSKERRASYSYNLYQSAQNHLKEIPPNLKEAEEKLRFALRFEGKEYVLNELGYVLYEQKKHGASLEILNRAKMISDSDATNFLIGINYLRLKRFGEARDIFRKITDNNSRGSAESLYNLGLAYQGLKDHKAAVVDFQKAVDISPNDADAVYELGFSLYKTGDENGAREQYEKLLKLDSGRAEKLRKVAKFAFSVPG